MKKFLTTLLSLTLFAPTTLAATIVSDYSTDLDQFETKTIAPVKITSTADDDITAEHGINILLAGQDYKILWDPRDLTFTGTAIDNGRVSLNPIPVYAADGKSLFIPVQENFLAGDWLQIQGLALRAYDKDFNDQVLGLDLTGDLVAEVSDINTYEVTDVEEDDDTAPYMVTDVTYQKNEDGSIRLNWKNPPDYDLVSIVINRTLKKGLNEAKSTVFRGYSETFLDTDLKAEDLTGIHYEIAAEDSSGHWSPLAILDISLQADTPDAQPTEPEGPTNTPTDEPMDDGFDQLLSLYNYYKVRYAIKCMPSGVAVAENNSACLWARIDLVYTQEVTGKSDIDVTLSDRDLELMTLRRQWPEIRYQENCLDADEPADYCPALGKALDRICYFLD